MTDPLLSHPNVRATMEEEGEGDINYASELELNETQEYMHKMICHVLRTYPGISGSMLQVGIGTSLQPKLWRPVFDKMVVGGQVIELSETVEAPSGRFQSYKHLRLAPHMAVIPTDKH